MEINEYLIKLIQTSKDMEGLELFPASSKLSRTEFRLIREVIMEKEQGKNIISSELARRIGITRSAVSQLVTKLEKRGIVKRVDPPDDKKIAYVQLSDHTLSVYNEQCMQANEFINKVVQTFGEEKMKNLMKEYEELAKVVAELREELKTK